MARIKATIGLGLLLLSVMVCNISSGDFFNGDEHSNCERVWIETTRADDGFTFLEEDCK